MQNSEESCEDSEEFLEGPPGAPFLPKWTLKERLAASLFLGIVPVLYGHYWWCWPLIVLGWLWFLVLLPKVWITLLAMDLQSSILKRVYPYLICRQCAEKDWFGVDGASKTVQQKRREGLVKLKKQFAAMTNEKSSSRLEKLKKRMPSVRLFDTRTPPPYQTYLRSQFSPVILTEQSEECFVVDIDGNKRLDISGSWGVNMPGHEKFKEFQKQGRAKTGDLSPACLGVCYHKAIAEVIEDLQKISKMDEVSFHMSGTEAVLAAIKMTRFNSKRRLIVMLTTSHHGWDESTMNSPNDNNWHKDFITLKYNTQSALKFIQRRHEEIAAVFFDPFVSMFTVDATSGMLTNTPTEQDKSLPLGARLKKHCAGIKEREISYAKELRKVCLESKVPLVFDEVWSGFKWSIPGSAMEAMGVVADMVLYGKTLGGGLPVGIICGKSWAMQRYHPQRPMSSILVYGTFTACPPVLGSMWAFLKWIQEESTKKLYDEQVKFQSEFFESLNNEFEKLKIGLEIHSYDLLFSIGFTAPTNYCWLFNYYCMAEGLHINVSGTTNCMASLEWKPEHYNLFAEKIKRAATRFFKEDGWYLEGFTKRDCQKIANKEFWSNYRTTLLSNVGLSMCCGHKPYNDKQPLLVPLLA